MSTLHELSDSRGALVMSASQGKAVVSSTKGVMSVPQQAAQISDLSERMEIIQNQMDRENARLGRYFNIRRWTLSGGLLLVVIARIATPYFS